MAADVKVTISGDSASLERSFANAGSASKSLVGDLAKAESQSKSFGSALDKTGDSVDASEGKFMATADLLDGLGGAFGLPIDGAVNMARSFGDMASGVTGLVMPAIQALAGKLGFMTAATATQTAATEGAAVAQGGLNAALLANPIGLIIAGLVALGVAFFVLWKKSETFRDIVRGAFDTVKGSAEGVWNFIKGFADKVWGVAGAIKDALIWPYKTAFNLIAKLWNNTVGNIGFDIPSWVPGVGGKGFHFPKIPEFHSGGIVPGPPGAEVPIMALAGERVTPAGAAGAAPITINVYGSVVTETQLVDAVHNGLLRKQKLTPLGIAS